MQIQLHLYTFVYIATNQNTNLLMLSLCALDFKKKPTDIEMTAKIATPINVIYIHVKLERLHVNHIRNILIA